MRTLLSFLACVLFVPLVLRGDDIFTQSQIETMERKGWITPQFEAAARELIAAKQDSQTAKLDQWRLESELPGLQKSAAASDAKVAKLKEELAHYDHPDETDFDALQSAMKDTTARPEDQLALAQAYVWTYPGGTHAGEAGQELQQIEKKIAGQVQEVKDAAAAQMAAQAKLLQRVKAHALSLGEWRAFLQDKSQAEVTQYLGAPSSQADDYWTYSGSWTIDPTTNQKAGLQLTFNGGRVQNVAPVPVSNP